MAVPDQIVWLVERNIHGGWTVYGALGIRQYYGYTEREAKRRYREDYKREIITCQ